MIDTLKKWYWRLGLANRKFKGSGKYWEDLYREGGNSGPGSYSRLAAYKAEFVNGFIRAHAVQKVIDLGCGDGNQLSMLKAPEYHGFDVSATIIANNKKRFHTDASRRFYVFDNTFPDFLKAIGQAELALSLDVIFHLVELPVFENYLRSLFSASSKYVIIYSTDYDSRQVFHEKNRSFSKWIAANLPQWKMLKHEKNPYPFDPKNPDETSECDFFVFVKK